MRRPKKCLHREEIAVAEVAERVGYSSASTFSVAYVGLPPTRYAREPMESASPAVQADVTWTESMPRKRPAARHCD